MPEDADKITAAILTLAFAQGKTGSTTESVMGHYRQFLEQVSAPPEPVEFSLAPPAPEEES